MKILVVEDEPLIRLGLVSLAEEWGYTAVEAGNADQAIAALERDPDIRLVITDVDMPGSMDGIRLAHFVRGRWPPLPIIVVSGKVRAEASTLPPGVAFLAKPYRDDLLHSAVTSLCPREAAP